MSAHKLPKEMLEADFLIVDPGASGTFAFTKGLAICPVVTVAAEGRTVPSPQNEGQKVLIVLDTDGGDCTVTITDGQGISSQVLNDAGDWLILQAFPVGGALKWFKTNENGVSGANYTADTLTVGSVIVSPYKIVTLSLPLNGDCVDQTLFIADRAYQVTRVDYVHATAGNDGSAVNVQVTKDTGTDAPGGGTNLLTNNTNAGFNCKATANTVQNGTLTVTTASLQMATGDRLAVDFAGTPTTLAGAHFTIELKAI
jgi:hypothetical protein